MHKASRSKSLASSVRSSSNDTREGQLGRNVGSGGLRPEGDSETADSKRENQDDENGAANGIAKPKLVLSSGRESIVEDFDRFSDSVSNWRFGRTL